MKTVVNRPERWAPALRAALLLALTGCAGTTRDDMVAQSEDLSSAIHDYDAYVTVTLPGLDVIPGDVADQIAPVRADFDRGVADWLDTTNEWDVGLDAADGVPSRPALVRFNEALTTWRDLQDWFVESITSCAGEQSVEQCVGSDPTYVDWQQAFATVKSTAKDMNADAAATG